MSLEVKPVSNFLIYLAQNCIKRSLRSMAALSSRAQERRSHEKFALQSPRGFSALARLYYLVRPTKTAMLRRLHQALPCPPK